MEKNPEQGADTLMGICDKSAITEQITGIATKVKFNEPLSRYTTLRVGGPAEVYIEVENIDQLEKIIKIARENKLSIFILGAGSNVLVSEKGLPGFVIRLKGEFTEISFNVGDPFGECMVKVGAGTMLPVLIKRAIDLGYSGLESLGGIPGSVGGALLMNAGTADGTISDRLIELKTMDFSGDIRTLEKKDIKFGYRESSLEGLVILEAKFSLTKEKKEIVVKKITENLTRRAKTQPLTSFNAGSIFKNPKNKYAAELIEQCGLKGHKIGSAQVSNKHANFIINTGNANSNDMQRLIFEVRKQVYKKFGTQLELEIKII